MSASAALDVSDFDYNYSGYNYYNTYPDCDQSSPSEYYATTMIYGTTSYGNEKGSAKA